MLSGNYIYGIVPLLLVLGCIVAFATVRLARSLTTAREAEARFRVLAQAIPEIVWTAAPGGKGLDFGNQRWFDLTGMTPAQTLGWGWKDAIHPDDLSTALANWEKSHETGIALSTQYRLRMHSEIYRWYLARATPMKNASGRIIKWFGSCVDIDDQIRHQELLEEQIKQHTAALRDANARLETEMRERALAQQELNQQNEHMVRELTVRSQRATKLAKTAELLQSCIELKDIYGVVAGMGAKVFPEFRGAMFLFNSAHDALEIAGSWGDCVLPAHIFAMQDCWALRTGHLHVVPVGDHTAECRHVVSGQFSYLLCSSAFARPRCWAPSFSEARIRTNNGIGDFDGQHIRRAGRSLDGKPSPARGFTQSVNSRPPHRFVQSSIPGRNDEPRNAPRRACGARTRRSHA